MVVGKEMQVFTYFTDAGILWDDVAHSMLNLFKPVPDCSALAQIKAPNFMYVSS